jgi:hypothetical protein
MSGLFDGSWPTTATPSGPPSHPDGDHDSLRSDALASARPHGPCHRVQNDRVTPVPVDYTDSHSA